MDNSITLIESLRSKTLLPCDDVLSTDEKLSWLSDMRCAFETALEIRNCSQGRTPVLQLVQTLKGLLTPSEDVFVVYEAQRLFVEVMKWNCFEEGLILIQEVLETNKCIETITCYLEVCRDLLSKQNPHCCKFLARIQAPLSHITSTYRHVPHEQSADQFLYQLAGIFFKIAKLANIFKSEETFLALAEIYLKNNLQVLDVLFNSDVKRFIKRKLCLTLYYIVKPTSALGMHDVKQSTNCHWVLSLGSELCHLADNFVRQTMTVGFEQLIWKIEHIDGFTGVANVHKGDNAMGFVHLREWCILSLGMALQLHKCSKGEANLPLELVVKLDKFVKEVLAMTSCTCFTWLPAVFGDQDDMWIDALLILLDLQPSAVSNQQSLDHHWYFLQFVSTIAYDHLVLIDLLTSPETCFLDYLTRYLKYLINTWTHFAAAMARFEKSCMDNDTDNPDNTTQSVDDTKSMDTIKSEEMDVTVLKNNISEEPEMSLSKIEMKGAGIVNLDATVHNKEVDIHVPDCLGKCYKFKVFQNASYEHEDRTDLAVNKNTRASHNSVDIEAKTTTGLSILMGTYSDSESELEEECYEVAGDIHKVEDCPVVAYSETKSNCANESTHADFYEVSDRTLESKVTGKHPIEIGKCTIETGKHNIGTGNSTIETGKQIIETGKHITETGKHTIEAQKCIREDEMTFSQENSDEALSIEAYKSQLEAVEAEERCVMDRTMGMLIRVMLKLQRLWTHKMIKYDPMALTRLLEEVETLYAETEK